LDVTVPLVVVPGSGGSDAAATAGTHASTPIISAADTSSLLSKITTPPSLLDVSRAARILSSVVHGQAVQRRVPLTALAQRTTSPVRPYSS
jgi:hypothetical protein